MTFPDSQLPVVVELDLAGDGSFSTNITSKVRVRDGIVITRGRSNETSTAEPSSCSLTLNNADGRFSPRKPDGPYYGQLRRNTEIRVSVTSATSWLQVDAATGATPAAGARVVTPDSANLSITSDIDVRLDADFDSWRSLADLFGKWTSSAGNKSWMLLLFSSGRLGWFWSADGTTELGATSTDVLPVAIGRQAVRVTHDVNNGAGGNTVTFYYSDSITGTWTQLGDPVVTSGTTSIFDSAAEVAIGDSATGSQANSIHGKVYGARIYQGIAGTLRASPDFTAQTHGASSFSDAQGNTWTLTGDVSLTTRDVRFVGPVPSWPTTWDVSQRNVAAPIQAAGVLRRIQTGGTLAQSTIYRAMTTQDNLVAYWPMEDGSDATEFASAIGGQPMRYVGTAPSFAAYDGFDGSSPVATLDNLSDLRGPVPSHTSTGEYQVRGLVAIPAGGVPDNTELISVNFNGTANHWQIRASAGGALTVRAFDADAGSLVNDGPWAFDINGKELLLHLGLTQNGSNIDYELKTWELEAEDFGLEIGGTLNSQTVGRCTRVQWNPNGGAADMSVGHTVLQNEITSLFDRRDEMRAYRGETAYDRLERLCGENGITFAGYGSASESTAMGPQKPGLLVDLIRQCEESDAGLLFEARDRSALAYRPRRSMYSQEPILQLDYTGRHLQSLVPVEDDDAARNDVTVSRVNGSSARATLDEGALSTQAPPNGIGRYEASYTLSLEDDSGLDEHAQWRLNLGTPDEARYPQIDVNLASTGIRASAATTAAVRALDVGDRLTVENMPSTWMPPDDVSQLAIGFTETLGPKTHTITANCAPESPYRVGVTSGTSGAAETRASCTGTVTAEALDTTETGVDITCPAGSSGWGHGDGDYDIVIGGEVMTVTGVSGTAPSQTFTVTRSVNGVVKSHSSGADVALADARRYGL